MEGCNYKILITPIMLDKQNLPLKHLWHVRDGNAQFINGDPNDSVVMNCDQCSIVIAM